MYGRLISTVRHAVWTMVPSELVRTCRNLVQVPIPDWIPAIIPYLPTLGATPSHSYLGGGTYPTLPPLMDGNGPPTWQEFGTLTLRGGGGGSVFLQATVYIPLPTYPYCIYLYVEHPAGTV